MLTLHRKLSKLIINIYGKILSCTIHVENGTIDNISENLIHRHFSPRMGGGGYLGVQNITFSVSGGTGGYTPAGPGSPPLDATLATFKMPDSNRWQKWYVPPPFWPFSANYLTGLPVCCQNWAISGILTDTDRNWRCQFWPFFGKLSDGPVSMMSELGVIRDFNWHWRKLTVCQKHPKMAGVTDLTQLWQWCPPPRNMTGGCL